MESKLQDILDGIFKAIENCKEDAFKLSDYLSDNPELSGKEIESSKHIVKLLESKSFDVEFPFGGMDTAFKANVSTCQNPKFKAAILVEYDALPEIGHGCGHSVSAGISVLAGLACKQVAEDLPIHIDLIGTPDEEVEGGKVILAENGVFDDYDLAIMIHLNNENRVAVRLLAVSDLDVKFIGKASHAAAAPWDGKNALNGMQLFFHATDMLRQHVRPDVRIHGIIKEGGTAANSVPEIAKASFFIRSENYQYLKDVVQQVKNCAKGAAIATGTEVEVKQLYASYTELLPNRTTEKLLENIYEKLDLEVEEIGNIPFGSSDVGNVSKICPTFHPTLSIVNNGAALHTREFAEAVKSDEAYKAIVDGARIITSVLAEFIYDEKLYENMKKDWRKQNYGKY